MGDSNVVMVRLGDDRRWTFMVATNGDEKAIGIVATGYSSGSCRIGHFRFSSDQSTSYRVARECQWYRWGLTVGDFSCPDVGDKQR